MNRLFAFLPLAAAMSALAQSNEPTVSEWVKDGTNSTIITSHRLTFDPEQRQAVFEGNVVVVDNDVTLVADRLVADFSEKNRITRITAEGSVAITQGDRVATGRKGVYDAERGEVTLTGNPKVQQGKDVMRGDVISFWPNTRKIRCEPNAILIIYADEEKRRARLDF